jgi:hypothetical protein
MDKTTFTETIKKTYDIFIASGLRVVKDLHVKTLPRNAMLATTDVDVKYEYEMDPGDRILTFEECIKSEEALNHIFSFVIREYLVDEDEGNKGKKSTLSQ